LQGQHGQPRAERRHVEAPPSLFRCQLGAARRSMMPVADVNSRLRNFFFLRRQLGKDYLTLLQFFLNHRRYLRSEDPTRSARVLRSF